VEALNKQGLKHLNLKPENILVDDPEKLNVKVVDYDFCDRKIVKDAVRKTFNPSYYNAPEVIDGKLDSTKSDIWSIGAILYTIISGIPPFFALSESDRLKSIHSAKYSFDSDCWTSLSSDLKDFISKCL
jgi:calcium-dependent protein kinase